MIHFEHVSKSYPKTDKPALSDLLKSLKVSSSFSSGSRALVSQRSFDSFFEKRRRLLELSMSQVKI
jgi:hypothetical protein